jgi:S-adenosylmethionine hydrolase
MAPRFDTVTFLSDYGTGDEFVGVVHSVIRSIAPHVTVIDLTHEIPAYDVRAGSLTLGRAAQYLCPGVVLAVVDPGVGTPRRGVAIEVGGGQSYLVGPDNGLLASAVAMSGGATDVVELTNADRQLAAPGATFAGRDIFAPAAAHLCNGGDLTDLGPLVDTGLLMPGIVALPRIEADGLHAEVLWVDRFGNCQLNVGPEDLTAGVDVWAVSTGDERRAAKLATSFGELGPGAVGLVLDSHGMYALAFDQRSAAAELHLATGDAVVLTEFDDAAAVTSPVVLRRDR